MKQEQPKNWTDLAEDYSCGTWIGEAVEIPTIHDRFRGKVQGLQLLDIGCGYGKHAKFFSDEGAKVTGIDSSDKMIALAKNKAPNATFYCTSADNLSVLEQNKFDLIVAVFLFPNTKTVEEFYRCCTAMRARLKPGGRLMVYDRHPMAFCNTNSELTKVILPPGTGYHDNGCKFEVHMRLKNNGWIQFYNYHWTFEHWHAQLHKAGLIIRSFIEPKPITIPAEVANDFSSFLKRPLHMMLEIEAK